MRFWLKKGSWLLLLAGWMLFGCVKGPLPDKTAWPWETSKDYEKMQTGNYFGIRGNVATFDEPPKTVKAVKAKEVAPDSSDSNSDSESAKKSHLPLLPAQSEPGSGKISSKAKDEYDFTLRDIQIAPPSYLPMDSVRTAYDITAFNHGIAPVSVTLGIDPLSSENIAADKTLPLTVVVKPNSDLALVHVGAKNKSESYNFRTTYSWNIGDYTASHNCPEHYRFPFGSTGKAFTAVSENATASTATRYAVIFSLPADTPVLAARKGTIVQIRTGKIDILHDDATIATYDHLGKISAGVYAGKAVSTEDIIGVVGTTADKEESYLQLTVWRPEPQPVASLKAVSLSAGFDFVSFPLEFCSPNSSECSVITQAQKVSRSLMPGPKKQDKRKLKKRV